MQIDGHVALITGGSSGLGAATAAHLVGRGARVVSLDVRPPRELLRGVEFSAGDVTEPSDVQSAVELAVSLGALRAVVNCAGVGSNERIVRRTRDDVRVPADLDDFRRVVEINMIGTFNCMRLAASAMEAPTDDECAGVIINTASIAAFEGQVGQAAYSASKAGIVALTLTAARDLAPLGIRVNAIAPGLMETPLFETVRDDIRAQLLESVVLPSRIGRPAEFAALVGHLIDNDYINGETIRIDAGARLPYRSAARP